MNSKPCDICGGFFDWLPRRPGPGIRCADRQACAQRAIAAGRPLDPFDPEPRELCPDQQLGTREGWTWCPTCQGIKEPGHSHEEAEGYKASLVRRIARLTEGLTDLQFSDGHRADCVHEDGKPDQCSSDCQTIRAALEDSE